MEEAKDNSNKKEMEEAKDNSNEKEMEEAKDNSNEKEMNKNENTLPSSASFETLNENNFEQWLDSNKITSFSKEKIQKAWEHLAKNLGDFIKKSDIEDNFLVEAENIIPYKIRQALKKWAGLAPPQQQVTSQQERKAAVENLILKPLSQREKQKEKFEELKKSYEQFKLKKKNKASVRDPISDPFQNLSIKETSPTLTLPHLGIAPKELPDPQTNQFIVRDVVLQLFLDFETFYEGTGFKNYGYYLKGPNGVGKSVAIYFFTCLAFAHDWVVVYIPQCDDWSSSSDQINAMKYFLRAVATGLGTHHSTKLKNTFSLSDPSIQTIGELVVSGINSNDTSVILGVYSSVLDEFRVWDNCPLLLVFDEVNGLFLDLKESWIHGKPSNTAPFRFAATLNLVDMKKGLKLISGTGHDRFLAAIQPGIHKYVKPLYPYDFKDFNTLLKKSAHNWLLEKLEKLENAKESIQLSVDKMIKLHLGRIPRQLYEFSKFINSTFSQTSPEEYLKIHKSPQEEIRKMLLNFELVQRRTFFKVCTDYLQSLDKDQQRVFLRSTFSLFFGWNSVGENRKLASHFAPIYTQDYLDLSIVYEDFDGLYKFITPAAEHATVELLRNSYSFENDKDIDDLLSITKENDEKSRAFERVFVKNLLINQCKQIKLIDFAGNPIGEDLDFTCVSSRIIPENRWCISDQLDFPTLLIPQDASYPIADFILFNPEKKHIIVFQLTLQKHRTKSPSQGSYKALFNETEWKKLSEKISPSRKDSKNFIEEIYYALGVGTVQVTLKQNQLQIITFPFDELSPSPYQFHWVIVCPRELKIDANSKELVSSYPWAKIISDKSLEDLLGRTLFNSLRSIKE